MGQPDDEVEESTATASHNHDPLAGSEKAQQPSSNTTLDYISTHGNMDGQARISHVFDSHNAPLDYGQQNVLSFDAMTPSAGFDFPTDLWFQGPSPSFSNILTTEPGPSTARPKPPSSTIYGASPYANCPLFHMIEDEGKSVAMAMGPISSFIQNRASWRQIQETCSKQWSNDVRSIPLIDEQTRDALVAITHITLSKASESACIRTMPLTFPPLQTVQCLFRSCLTRFARLYPIIHPLTFDIVADHERDGATYPIFLQNIMILGALLLCVKEGQAFAIELAYLVRQAMHDTMTQDVLTTNDVWMLSSTILITAVGAWSGNKVHVELAEAYRGSYTTVGSETLREIIH